MGELIAGIIIIVLVIFVTMIPIKIAESRGIKGQSLTIIKVLSWLGILLLITWIVALIMSLVCEVKDSNSLGQNTNYLKALEQLQSLKEKGGITEAEFNAEKAKLLNIK